MVGFDSAPVRRSAPGGTLSGWLSLLLLLAAACDGTSIPGDGTVGDASPVVPGPGDASVCTGGLPPPPVLLDAARAVSFRRDLLPLFGARCNFGGCHAGLDEPGQLRLGPSCVLDVATSTCVVADGGLSAEVAAVVQGNLLGPALAAPGMARTQPGSPRTSFVIYKLSGCQGSALAECEDCGNPMPPGAPLRETAPGAYALIWRWIEEGAALD